MGNLIFKRHPQKRKNLTTNNIRLYPPPPEDPAQTTPIYQKTPQKIKQGVAGNIIKFPCCQLGLSYRPYRKTQWWYYYPWTLQGSTYHRSSAA